MDPTRSVLVGVGLALLVGAPVLAAPLIKTLGAATVRSEAGRLIPLLAAVPVDPGNLVRFRDRDYLVQYEAGVSLEPLASSVIRKIAGGVVSEVTVVQTTTGTYSSEATVSPHVRYPGITVIPLPELPPGYRYVAPVGEDGASAETAPSAQPASGALARETVSEGSFVVLRPPVTCPSADSRVVCI
jgi:hypothetical protein